MSKLNLQAGPRGLNPKKVLSHTPPCDYILRALLLVSLIDTYRMDTL